MFLYSLECKSKQVYGFSQMVHSPETIIGFATRLAITVDLYYSVLSERLRPFDLTISQLSVISHLARRQEPQRVTDIAKSVDVGQPAVTKMITKFENAGWVTLVDSISDKRVKAARMTPEGYQHLGQVQRHLLPELKPFLDQKSEADIKTVTDLLKDFSALLETLR